MHEPRGSQGDSSQQSSDRREYWRRNQRLIALLLTLWALVSLGFSILLAKLLEGFRIGQLPAGFWWAQQGAMVVFVLLIFFYAWRMDRLDRRFGLAEEDDGVDAARKETEA